MPRLQLFTVGELLGGKKVEMPMFGRNTRLLRPRTRALRWALDKTRNQTRPLPTVPDDRATAVRGGLYWTGYLQTAAAGTAFTSVSGAWSMPVLSCRGDGFGVVAARVGSTAQRGAGVPQKPS
jgi:hypothetical protein